MTKLLHELTTDYAGLFPSKAAAEDARGVMTYGELNARSGALAAALEALGLRAGEAAAVYVPYAKEIVLGAVAVLRAGGVFVPFDDAYPAARLETMLEDCEAKAILTVRELWDRQKLCFPEERVLFMDEIPEGDEASVCSPALDEASPAMLLYTSGTTGKPKGVPHSNGFLLHIADWMKAHEGVGMNAETRSGVMSAFPFVGTQMFLLGPLVAGGTVCIAPAAARSDLDALYHFLRAARITHSFVPSGLAAFLAEDYDISGIHIFAAGEKLRPFHPYAPGNNLINSYGSTETGGVLSEVIHGDEQHITVGKPSPGARIRLVDESMNRVAPGDAGELLISSANMARQYHKRPDLNVEKWTETNGDLWFRTNDRARCTADGDLELLGRTDNMIKLRGFRIETGEVEAQIVRAAAALGGGIGQPVVVKKTIGGTEHLCCYYEAEKDLDSQALTEEISRYLAPYMVPDVWVRMDALPRNANGKVLRNNLPQPRRERKAFGALDSEVTARLVWTAAEVLDLREMISPDDSFTALGGTSLTAMKLSSRLRDQGIRVTAAQILRLNSLRKIAEAADVLWEQLWTPEEREKVRQSFAERGERIQKVLPISSWQDEMLFDQILHPDWSSFRNVVLLQLDSVIAQADLREALDTLSAENEELRSAIVFHGVTTVQQVITDRKIPLDVIEAASFGEQEMAAMRRRILLTPMDLQYSSLMQVIAVHAGSETLLYILTHRIALDTGRRRAYLARMMRFLESRYPDDRSVSGWREILEQATGTEPTDAQSSARREPAVPSQEAPPEICVYSENKGPKLVFVHTGNTGSEAYYRLASRIGHQVSFAVIEPFNLYHPAQARYGIPEIAAKYIKILKRHQPQGPYLLGGWCYGGVVAHEMACQLEQAGEEVRHLFLLDAHAMGSEELVTLSRGMHAEVNRDYFETSPLFADLRANGMLEAMVTNAAHVSEDLMRHTPSLYRGNLTYFKPMQIPAGASEESRGYWQTMMEFAAGNYERYCLPDKLRIVATPHEHDLMMDDPSLDIIAPEILRAVGVRHP